MHIYICIYVCMHTYICYICNFLPLSDKVLRPYYSVSSRIYHVSTRICHIWVGPGPEGVYTTYIYICIYVCIHIYIYVKSSIFWCCASSPIRFEVCEIYFCGDTSARQSYYLIGYYTALLVDEAQLRKHTREPGSI